jgi:Tfp pilus assembly PilM family ATPase
MKSSTKSCCGLDLQKEYLSVVLYFADKRAATPVILKPLSSPAGADTEIWNLWEAELKNIKGQLRHYASSIICGIPADFAVIKICSTDADEDAPREVLEWELSQQIIGSIDEYMFDFQKTADGDGASVSRYLVAAYRKEYVDRLAGMIRKIKLEPRIVDFDVFGLVNAFEANYPEKMDQPAVLVHCENRMTKLVLTKNGGFLDYHCLEHTASYIDPDPYAAAVAAEIEQFLSVSPQAHGGVPGGVYLTGSFLKADENRTAAIAAIPGAEILNPFKEIKCQLEGIDEKQLLEHSTQLAVATGLSLRTEE